MASPALKKRVIRKVTEVESDELLKKVDKLLDDDRVETLRTPTQQRELEREIALRKAGRGKSISWENFKKKVEKRLAGK